MIFDETLKKFIKELEKERDTCSPDKYGYVESDVYKKVIKRLKNILSNKLLHIKYEDYIKHSKEGALVLIKDLCIGYDGCSTIPELKKFIDEIRAIALLGLIQKK